ncbi:MAG: penicillin acylase family protein [Myxococcota bacterium]
METHISTLLVLLMLASACSGGNGGVGEVEADLEWPPRATVHFDGFGILHADCETDEDCAMVLGYHHAQDRFVQMDIRRRFATGRLADLVARPIAEALEIADVAAETRALFSTRSGQPAEQFVFEQSSDKTVALLTAYSAGVNAWIADAKAGRNGATFPVEFSNVLLSYTVDEVPTWTPQDSLATVLALIENLTNEENSQVAAGVARERIGDDLKFADLYSRQPLKPSSVLPPGEFVWPNPSNLSPKRQVFPDRPRLPAGRALDQLHQRLERRQALSRLLLGQGFRGDQIGSNSWVVAPSRSRSGNALFSNDPHLSLTQPTTWYIAHVDAKTNGTGDIHAAGLTFAGLPWVITGQNEHVVWGSTTASLDHSDIYIDELATNEDGTPIGIVIDDQVREFIEVPFDVVFDDGSVDTRTLRFVAERGAVREIDLENGVAITLRWTGNDADTDQEFPTALSTAASVEEARQAFEAVTTIGQCFAVIDIDGNIGWFPYNRLPRRDWATDVAGGAASWLPLDGRGNFEWEAFFSLSELPQSVNPERGYIANGNNDLTGALFDGDATNEGPPLQTEAAQGFRHARIAERIEAIGDQHDVASMEALVGDVYSLIGADMTPAVLAIANDTQTVLSENAEKVVNALSAWDYECPTGLEGTDPELSPLSPDVALLESSSGCAAFHVAVAELGAAITDDEGARRLSGPSFAAYHSIVDPTQLTAGDVYWDDTTTEAVETKYDIVGAALDTAGSRLVGALGTDEGRWAWGRLHAVQLRSDLSVFGISDYDNPPNGGIGFANDGGLYTVDVANPNSELRQLRGASARLVCEGLPTGPSCSIQLPGGQSSDPNSANYEDLLVNWLSNTSVPLVFDIEEAAASAVRSIDYRTATP